MSGKEFKLNKEQIKQIVYDYMFQSVTLEIEDRTEQTLHKDLPYRYTSSVDIPDKHKNIPIPIVYGFVEKSPIVYEELINPLEYELMADDFYIKSVSTPQTFADDVYGVITEEAPLFEDIKENTIYNSVDTNQQYYQEESTNRIIFPKTFSATTEGSVVQGDISGLNGSPIAFNFVEVETISKVYPTDSTYRQWAYEQGTGD